MVPAPATSPPLPATATSGRRGLRSRAWTTQVQSKATPAPREGGEGLRLRGESLPGTWPGADVHFGKALLAGHCREEVGAVGTGGHTGSERPSGAGSAAGGADGTRGGGPGLWVGGAVSPRDGAGQSGTQSGVRGHWPPWARLGRPSGTGQGRAVPGTRPCSGPACRHAPRVTPPTPVSPQSKAGARKATLPLAAKGRARD